MQTNIYDVAKNAGVSIATVSRVLNNKGQVKEETREKILKAINELNFQPNMNARGLAHNTTKIIGALLPEFSDYSIPDSFLLEFLNGVQQMLSEYGYSLLIINGNTKEGNVPDLIKIVQGKRIDGLITVFKKLDYDLVDICKDIPIVSFSENNANQGTIAIEFDFYKYSNTAIQYIKDFGHRNIASVFYASNVDEASNKLNIFKNIFYNSDLNFNVEEAAINGAVDKVNLFDRILKLLSSKKYTAVFVDSVFYAQQVIDACRQMGQKVPEDVSIICLEYLKNEAFWLHPPITGIHVDSYSMGNICANMLLSRIDAMESSITPVINTVVYDRSSIRYI